LFGRTSPLIDSRAQPFACSCKMNRFVFQNSDEKTADSIRTTQEEVSGTRYLMSVCVCGLIMLIWAVSFPLLWLYARLFPRVRERVLFWTNEGFRVAPSRVRSYRFCEESQRMGLDASVLSFWDHLEGFTGLPPYDKTPAQRALVVVRAMFHGLHSRARIIVAQRPMYDVTSLLYLKCLYPVGISIWIDLDDWIHEYPLLPEPVDIRFKHMLPILSAIADGCIVSSLPLEQDMATHFKRVEIVPTFVDARLFHPTNEDQVADHRDTVVFSWIGTFFEEAIVSDILFLVEVLESLQDSRILLEIVGDGQYRKEVSEKAETISKVTTISFLGWLEPDSIPEYMQGIDIGLYCLSTHTDFTRSKSPTKLFEYMACAKPTVSTNFGEAPRFVEHGVTGFVASDFEQFAECCSRLLNDPALRISMGRNAREKIEDQHNLTSCATKLRNIIMGVQTMTHHQQKWSGHSGGIL